VSIDQKIEKLKDTVRITAKFEEAMNEFLDLVEAHPQVVTEATLCNPLPGSLIASIVRDVSNDPVSAMSLLRYGDLVHGTLLVGNRLATVIWFPEIKTGVLGLIMSRTETRFTRFRLASAPNPERN
jgi:hypothetical protein